MTNEEQLVEQLLVKYRFTEPVQKNYKEYIASSKRKNLTVILKKQNSFSFAIWGTLIIYMMLRKFGITVSFFQAGIISVLTATVVVATASAGTIKLVAVSLEKGGRIEQRVLPDKKNIEMTTNVTPRDIKSAVIIKFTGAEDAGPLSDRATVIFADTLKKEFGTNNISYGNSTADKKYIITGSVEKLQEGYLLTSRIIEKSSSVIIHMEMKEIHGEEKLYEESKKMAKKVAGILK